MQRVVTVAGDSLVGAKAGGVNRPYYRKQEGYRGSGRWLGVGARGQSEGKKGGCGGEKALQID